MMDDIAFALIVNPCRLQPQAASVLEQKMDRKNMQRYINIVTIVLGLVIASAVVCELIFPGSYLAKITGFIAFGALCIFLRTVPPKFFIPKPNK